MATLTNTKIKDTYDGLLKTTDNEALDVSGVTLIEDGLGNASALSVGRSGNGVTITGSLNATLATAAQPNITSVGTLSSLSVSGNLAVDTNTLYVDAADNWVGIGKTSRLDTQTKFQVSAGNSGVTSFSSFGDDVIIENSTNVGLTLATPNNGFASILFADPEVSGAGSILYDHSGDNLRISTNNEERMRIDSSGNVGIGKSNPSGGYGKQLWISSLSGEAEGQLILEGSSGSTGQNVGTIAFVNNGNNVSVINGYTDSPNVANSGGLKFQTYSNGTGSERMRITSTGILQVGSTVEVVPLTASTTLRLSPMSDTNVLLGLVNRRWSEVFAVNGTINTSDANEKQQIESLDEAELRVATRIKGLIKKFKWNSAVEEKGENARIHIGVIAQDVKAAFEAEGLDAHKYSLFTQDTWWEKEVVEIDEQGVETTKIEFLEEFEDGAVERTRLGVRYTELLAFVIAAL